MTEALNKNEMPTLEELFEVLDQMIEKLEDRNISLDKSFQLYEEGMNLLKTCNEQIDHVEKKMLIMDENGDTNEF